MKLLNTFASIVLAAAAPVGPPSLEAVQNEFKENLADPDNARFRNVEIVPHKLIPDYFTLCGQVNARNSLGGYTGFQPFMAHVQDGHIVGTPIIAEDYQTLRFIADLCDPRRSRQAVTTPTPTMLVAAGALLPPADRSRRQRP